MRDYIVTWKEVILDADETEAFPRGFPPQFSERRESKVPQLRHGHARRLPFVKGGRNERITVTRKPGRNAGLFLLEVNWPAITL